MRKVVTFCAEAKQTMMRFVGATKEVRRRNGFEGVRFLGTKPDVDLLMNMYEFEKEAIRRAAVGDFQGCFEGAYPQKLRGVVNNPRPVATAHLGLREAFKPTVEKPEEVNEAGTSGASTGNYLQLLKHKTDCIFVTKW